MFALTVEDQSNTPSLNCGVHTLDVSVMAELQYSSIPQHFLSSLALLHIEHMNALHDMSWFQVGPFSRIAFFTGRASRMRMADLTLVTPSTR